MAKTPATKKPAAKAGKVSPKNAAPSATKERGPSASSRFKELILAGGQSDDAIFAIVQKEFNLADDKRSYVGWYRANLRKTGQNPPPAMGAEAKPAAKKPPVNKAAAGKKASAPAKKTPPQRKPKAADTMNDAPGD